MKKENYSLLVMVFRIIAGVFGLIAFALMFLHQLDQGTSGSLNISDIAFGLSIGINAAPGSFIGYILILLAALASIALIFVRNMLGDVKLVKLVDYIIGGAFILGGVLVAMTKFWYWAVNASTFTSAYLNQLSLAGAPITVIVFAVIAAALNILNGAVEEKI